MSDRLPWFRCYPSALLGALAGMEPDEGYVYVAVLLRIYETGGPVAETSRTLSRRTGLAERKVAMALAALIASGKIVEASAGWLDSLSTHEELAHQAAAREGQSKAGKASAAQRAQNTPDNVKRERAQKAEQNQRTAATSAERSLNHKERDREEEKKISPNGEATTAREATRLPSDWKPSEQEREYARSQGLDDPQIVTVGLEYADFWHRQKGDKGKKFDWFATWRNRVDDIAARRRLRPVRDGPGNLFTTINGSKQGKRHDRQDQWKQALADEGDGASGVILDGHYRVVG